MRSLVPALVVVLTGCAQLAAKPEIAPDRWAPHGPSEVWAPEEGAATYAVPQEEQAPEQVPAPGAKVSPTGVPTYSLPELIGVALANNPRTRSAWERARAAAAAYGASRAPYYPTLAVRTSAGYTRELEELVGDSATLRKAYAEPALELTYRLLDFGRRSAGSDSFRQQLAAANFAFNRSLQTVVFETQRTVYALAAAKAAVAAAEQNLTLSQTDDEAVNRRVELGLATEPALLLSRAQVAQSRFDLANARLFVREAQANLAVAIGVAANAPFDVEDLDAQQIPAAFPSEVGELIADAVRQRPDLAAEVASLEARRAEIERARAAFYPRVDVRGAYGGEIWNFRLDGPPTQRPAEPAYAGQLTFSWDLFSGFERENRLRQAEAERAAAAASLRSSELATIAEVWRAYYAFESTREKYAAAQALLEASEAAHAANLETYRNGLSTIVELLAADRDVANARFTRIQSTADLLTATAGVTYAIGAVEVPKGPKGP